MRAKHLFAAALGAALPAAALAQPAATDLGNVGAGTSLSVPGIAIGPAQIVWYTFTLTSAVRCDNTVFLDIDTEGSALAPSNDTEIGLYTSAGNLVATDDDDGSLLLSQLSFGGAWAPRPAVGTGVAYNGRDGANLSAGLYYLCIAGYNSTFGATGWTVTSTSANTGTGVLNINCNNVAPQPPPGPGTYVEPCASDVGDLPATAAAVNGSGALNAIQGRIGTGDADMYLINICDSANFSASTLGGATIDTQLFLLRTDGTGIAMDDDDPTAGSTVLQSLLPAGNALYASLTAGDYLLAISTFDKDPVDSGGLELWIDTPYRVVRGPDGPGGANPIAAWAGTGGTGTYTITLTGACFRSVGCPMPGCNDGGVDADIDNNCEVSLSDLALQLANFGSSGPGIPGDVDNDGDVDLADLAQLLGRFGNICHP